MILLEQLRTIDKRRLKDKVCHLDDAMLDKVNHALEISLELTLLEDQELVGCIQLDWIMGETCIYFTSNYASFQFYMEEQGFIA